MDAAKSRRAGSALAPQASPPASSTRVSIDASGIQPIVGQKGQSLHFCTDLRFRVYRASLYTEPDVFGVKYFPVRELFRENGTNTKNVALLFPSHPHFSAVIPNLQ